MKSDELKIVIRLVNGQVHVEAPSDVVAAYGLLELARDVIQRRSLGVAAEPRPTLQTSDLLLPQGR